MKSLLVAIILLVSFVLPAFAQETATVSASPSPTPNVLGLYDEDITSTNSASLSATPTPTPTATPAARATTYLDTSTAPVSGAVENTIIMLGLGIVFITLGIYYSRNPRV